MESVTKTPESPNTPALDLVFDRVIAMFQEDEPDRYPSGSAFLAADLPGFDSMLKGHIQDHDSVVVVFPDGRELIATAPRNRAVGALRRLLARLEGERNGPVAPDLVPIQIPADYVVELRERAAAAA